MISHLDDPNHVLIVSLLAAGLVLAWLATDLMVRRGRRLFLDTPNARSAHTTPTPRGGGIAFVTVSLLALAIYGFFARVGLKADCRWIPLAVFPLFLVGVVDDLRGLAAPLRFLAQMLTACLIVILLGRPLPTFVGEVGIAATALGVFAVTIPIAAAINFYNFMDGLDGLVATSSLVQLAFLAWYLDVPPIWLVVTPVAGFLFWNWPPARIFMGDTGSTFLGAAPVMAGILSDAPPAIVIAAWTVTTPILLDATVTLLRRAARRENIFAAHREHLYQRLHRLGWSHRAVTLSYAGATAACAALIALAGAAGAVAAVVLCAALLGVGEIHLRRHAVQ